MMMGGGGGFGRFGGMRGNLTEEEKKNMPKITKKLLKRVFSYLSPYKKQLFFVILTITASAAIGILPPILTGKIVDEGLNGRNFNLLIIFVAASFGVYISSNLIGILESYVNSWISQHIVFDMRNQMYRHLEYMPHRFFTNEKQGDIITRMTSDIGGVREVISNTMTNIVSNVMVLVLTIIALFSKNVILAFFGILIVPLFIIPTKKVGKSRFDLLIKTQKKNDEMNQILNETLNVSGSLLTKIFTKEEEEYDKYKKINKELVDLSIKETMTGRWFRMTIGVFTNMGPMLMYLIGGIIIIKLGDDRLTVGDVIAMIGLLNRLYGPVNSLFNIQIEITRSMALFTRIFDYFDMDVEIKNIDNPVVPEIMRGEIEFDNVSFHYSPDVPILKNMSVTIKEGTTVAVVGPSGAGKSTVINLIPRLYDSIEGEIRIDGVNIRDLDLKFLRSNIGYVTQDTYLFNATIKENLLYANGSADDATLDDACRKANIYDFIMSLPDKYETLVGNRGLKLSGGEKQRISLARVILKSPKILILDEATSALDSISESLIQEAIKPLLQGRTSVVIAHRLSTIVSADEIIVVDDGRIVERGVHADLINQESAYKVLYETQFKKALEDIENYSEGNPRGEAHSDFPMRMKPDGKKIFKK